MKKKFFALLIFMLLLALSTTPAAWAATVDSGSCGDNLTWTLDSNGTLTISGDGAMWDYSLEWHYFDSQSYNYFTNAPWGEKYNDITQLNIENGITTIGKNSFYNMNKLKQINIPASVYIIDNDAFSYCASLQEANIPNGVKYVEARAFANCTSLQTINIPASVQRIEADYFGSCSNLIDFNVDSGNRQYSSPNGLLYNKEGNVLYVYPAGRDTFEINPGTTTISAYALQDCSKISEIVIPDSVETINVLGVTSPFDGCDSLTKVTLPQTISGDWSDLFRSMSSITEIIMPEKAAETDYRLSMSSTFLGCTSLREIKIPEGVSILYSTFSRCENLETIYLPASIKTIGSNTFYRCYNLQTIVYAGTETQWGTIEIADDNVELDNANIIFLNNSPTTPTEPENPDKPTTPTEPETPENPDKPTTPTAPDTPGALPITAKPGGLGSKLTVRVTGGHWLTIQVRRAGSIAITSVQAPGQGTVEMIFSAAAGSTVQVWETEQEMTFTNGVPDNKILAVSVKTV